MTLTLLIRRAGALLVGLTLLLVQSTASAHAVESSTGPGTSGEIGIMSVWQTGYYTNYFASRTSCNNRGYQMKYYEEIPGMLNWQCYRSPGDPKWSMDILWAT